MFDAMSPPCRPQKCSAPLNIHLASTRRLNDNNITNYGQDMSAVLKLAEALSQSQLQSLR